MAELKPIEDVIRDGGVVDLGRFKRIKGGALRGPCPIKDHRSAKTKPFVIYPSSADGPGGWHCHAGCGKGGVRELAEQLGVDPYKKDGLGEETWPVNHPVVDHHKRLTAEQAEEVVEVSRAYLAEVLEKRSDGDGAAEEVFRFCTDRSLPGVLEPDEWWDSAPIAGILPLQPPATARDHLKRPARSGYRLVLPLYDKSTGTVRGLHLRNVRPGAEPKTLSFGNQGDGVLLANEAGRKLLAAEYGEDRPTEVYVVEGASDFLAVSLQVSAPVLGLAGAGSAAKVVTAADGESPTSWLSGVDLVIATDSDEAGEKAAKVITDVAFRKGGARSVLRVAWPHKDACDLLQAEGTDALRSALTTATPVEHPRHRFRVVPGFVQFLKTQHRQPRALVGDGLIRERDFVLLSGKAYSGKSWITLDLALATGTATEWLGFPTDSCRVGVFSREIEASDLQARLRTLMERRGITADRDLPIFPAVYPYVKGHVDLVEDLDGLKDFCQHNRLDLLILDPLSRLHTTDENSAHEFKPVMMAVDEIREECRTAVLLVHHDRKGGGGPEADLDAPRGSSLLTTNPTVSMRLVELDKFRKLSFHLNHAKRPDPVHMLPCEDGGFVVADAPKFGKQLGEANEAKVRELLEERGSLTLQEGQDLAHTSEGTVRKVLKKFESEGLVTVKRDGRRDRYHLNTPRNRRKGVVELVRDNDSVA